MTPIEYYHQQLSKDLIIEDQQQLVVLQLLQQKFYSLLQEHKKRSHFYARFRRTNLIQGLYLWGGVGIGKTFLMDCFYHCIPFPEKMRMHFHQFMQFVHQALKQHQGKKNPLQIIAKELAQKCQLLCFDELVVSDITDAMLLGCLFDELFSQGICLIATSNVMPDDLYKNGLQRRQFLPAIDLLKQNTMVVYLPSRLDYRSQYLKAVGVFYTPNDRVAHQHMEKKFALLTNGMLINEGHIDINGRAIQVKKRAGNVVWFDFDVICNIPRSQLDYLAIAEQFHTVFISNVPVISAHARNTISLFIRLVDVFYDAKIRLVFSAEKQIKDIYSQGQLLFDYLRTHSRLIEMQSEQYFQAATRLNMH